MTDSREARFHPAFEQAARGVRTRLAGRHALTGAALGLALALLPSAAAWRTRHGAARYGAPALGVVGAALGLAAARRRRWSDTEVALYLDATLETDEAIATAVGLRNEAERGDPARAVVVTSAANALASESATHAHPAVLRRVHVLAPIAALGLAVVAWAPLPAAATPPVPPGSGKVTTAGVRGLDKIADLAKLKARDDEQQKRLEKLAKDADKLREDLKKGLEQREAQDRIARLREQIAAERLSLGDGEQRAGLESAMSKLAENDLTKQAAKDLGDHDLESLDEDMERLANARERADRDLAHEKLREAADAASQAGGKGVGKALEDEQKLLDQRGARADALRELADAMKEAGESSPDVQEKSSALDEKKSDAAAKKLADALGKALEKLTPEERKKLAEKLKAAAKKAHDAGRMDADSMKELADDLATPEGEQKLEDDLRDMANSEDQTDEAKREEGLDEAEEGADDAENQMGSEGPEGAPKGGDPKGAGKPSVGLGHGSGRGKRGKHGAHKPGGGNGEPGGDGDGPSPPGDVSHDGHTDPVAADTFKSKAHAHLNKGAGMPGSTTVRAPGRAGGTANTRGTGDLRVVGPQEVDGIERSDVPEEYRDQVRQYFQP